MREEKIYFKIYEYLRKKGYEGKLKGQYEKERRNKGFNITFIDSGLCFKFNKRRSIFDSNAVVYNGKLYNEDTYIDDTLIPAIGNFTECLKERLDYVGMSDYKIKYKVKSGFVVFKVKLDSDYFNYDEISMSVEDLLSESYEIDSLVFEVSKSSFNYLDPVDRKIVSYKIKVGDFIRISLDEGKVEYDNDYIRSLYLNGFDMGLVVSETFRDFISYFYNRKNTKIVNINFKDEIIKISIKNRTNYRGKRLEYEVNKDLKCFVDEEEYKKAEKEIKESLRKAKASTTRAYDNYLEKKKKELEAKIEKSKSIYESDFFKDKPLLCYCVLNFLHEHEYMSKTSLKAFLSGKKMNSFYHPTIGYGAFGNIDEMEVLSILEEYGITYSSSKYNSYGTYVVSYYIEKDIKSCLFEIINSKLDNKDSILYNIKHTENFKDMSFVQDVLDDYSLLVIFKEVLKEEYENMDDTIKIYLETISGLETDNNRKSILEYILK